MWWCEASSGRKRTRSRLDDVMMQENSDFDVSKLESGLKFRFMNSCRFGVIRYHTNDNENVLSASFLYLLLPLPHMADSELLFLIAESLCVANES